MTFQSIHAMAVALMASAAISGCMKAGAGKPRAETKEPEAAASPDPVSPKEPSATATAGSAPVAPPTSVASVPQEPVPLAKRADVSATELTQILSDIRFTGAAADSVFSNDTLQLGTIEPENEPPPLLIRELGRQALLSAARDGLGLATRDRTLRESFGPAMPGAVRPVELAIQRGKGSQVVLIAFRRNGEAIEPLWREEVAWKDEENPLEAMTRACESFARELLPRVLKEAGYTGQPAALGAAAVPDTAGRLIDQMDVVSQYAAIRLLHSEIRKTGESPARLAALSLAYAQLGTMLELVHSAADRVYKARGLIYAERALVRTSGGAAELWNRARVKALLGMHASALNDVAAARRAAQKSTPPVPEPAWGLAIEAACQWDYEKMAEQMTRPAVKGMATYLNMLPVALSDSQKRVLASAEACLAVHPECLRAVDTLASISELGPVRLSAEYSLSVFQRSFAPRIAQLADIPVDVRTAAETHGKAGPDAFDARNAFLDQLDTAGSPARDRGEPSLAAIAQAGRELGFVQAWYQIQAATFLGYPLRQHLPRLAPLLKKHPYGAILESFVDDPDAMKSKAGALAQLLDAPSIETSSEGMIQYLYRFDKSLWVPWLRRAFRHLDDTALDLHAATLVMRTDDAASAEFERLRRVSPHAPPVVAYGIRKDWATLAPRAAELERRYKDNRVILQAMAEKFEDAKDFDAAARCYERCIELDPEMDLLFSLAEIYAGQKNEAKWKATLEKVLTVPAAGLEHATARNKIARLHIARREFKEALPYAKDAAQSKAGWAFETLADCYEGLGSWKEAEATIVEMSQHYEDQATTWFFWCQRSGHGNVTAARKQAERYFASLPKPLSPEEQQHLAAFSILAKKKEDALKALEESVTARFDPFTGLHAAVLADELRKTGLRDSLLQTTLQKGPATYLKGKRMLLVIKLAEQYSNVISRRKSDAKATLDLKALKVERRRANAGENTQVDYLLGRILARYGSQESSREAYLSAATSPEVGYPSFLAGAILRDAKVVVGPRREKEYQVDPIDHGEVDPERRVAEWVISKKGSVVVSYLDGSKKAERLSKPPIAEDAVFTVKEVDFFGVAVKDEELKNLAGLSRIETLQFHKPITGTGLKDVGSLPTLQSLSLSASLLTDEALETVAHFGGLESLSLHDPGPQITERGLGHLTALSRLRHLWLSDVAVTDAGLEQIGRIKSLTTLRLGGGAKATLPQLNDAGLAHLKGLSKLEALHIIAASITDDGLKHLAAHNALSILHLSGNKLTGEGLKHLPAGKLSSLFLDGCGVTDAGVKTLARFPKLQLLSLGEAAVTDAGVMALADIKSLKQVNLHKTKLSAESFEALAKAMPNCKINTK